MEREGSRRTELVHIKWKVCNRPVHVLCVLYAGLTAVVIGHCCSEKTAVRLQKVDQKQTHDRVDAENNLEYILLCSYGRRTPAPST